MYALFFFHPLCAKSSLTDEMTDSRPFTWWFGDERENKRKNNHIILYVLRLSESFYRVLSRGPNTKRLLLCANQCSATGSPQSRDPPHVCLNTSVTNVYENRVGAIDDVFLCNAKTWFIAVIIIIRIRARSRVLNLNYYRHRNWTVWSFLITDCLKTRRAVFSSN